MTDPTAIRELRCFSARSTLSRPIADATHVIPAIEFVIAEIELANGVVGQSYLLAFHYSPQALRGACSATLPAFARGRDATATLAFIRDWNRETEYFGQEGLQRWALGLANVAMWDAHARTLDVPVWRLLGGEARAIPGLRQRRLAVVLRRASCSTKCAGTSRAASRRSSSRSASRSPAAILRACVSCARPSGRTCAS